MNTEDFVNYMLDFYGKGGVYSEHKFTAKEVEAGLRVYIATGGYFSGDSIDRERVRDIILIWRGE